MPERTVQAQHRAAHTHMAPDQPSKATQERVRFIAEDQADQMGIHDGTHPISGLGERGARP
eukprot:CAMPEP_0185197452 /NCGR_PEP_ID=MMETSP1140-20130426/40420_1 /TAXON_ID=298111 /ORGANISM="Pavlova sp., Strain CCMP459" /LENGTH=60 /DNA_ID=CAMNT_0027764569 /DNA_START=163 /DNA_END=341 /DNA_ORIENTATION=+